MANEQTYAGGRLPGFVPLVQSGSDFVPLGDTRPLPVSSGPRATTTATIANGGTNSGSVDLTNTALLAFIAPAAWTPATLKLEGSADNTNWSNILDPDGAAVSSYPAVTAGAAYSIDVADMLPYRYVRFVSGAAQGADRTFTVITRPLA